MRLPIEQVREGLLHPDKSVRTEVAYFFSRSFSRDPAIMSLAIRAIERYGWDEAFDHYTCLVNLAQTEETVRWLILQLRQWVPADCEANDRRLKSLRRALLQADPQLLQPYANEIRDLNALDEEGREAADDQLSMPSQRLDQLWLEVEDWCELYEDDECVADEMLDWANRLVRALAKYPAEIKERVLSILRRDSRDSELWMDWFAICLAGEIRLEAAVPSLIAMLPSSGELYGEEICEALTKVGTPQIVASLAVEFPAADWDFRLFVACLLEQIHSDLSVRACLDLFSCEADHVIRCHLLTSALLNFATEAIEPARQYILASAKDPDLLEVRHGLLVACKLTGERFPEFDAWQEDANSDQEFRRKWYKEHPFASDNETNALDEELIDGTWIDNDNDLNGEFLPDDEPSSAPLTIVRRDERVGRNDPCPCGSGKKYKKCCYGRMGTPIDTDLNHASAMSDFRPPKKSPRYPIGTLAWYGPDDERTTKMVAAIIQREGAAV